MSERSLRGTLVTVFGGSGFLGRYIVDHLAQAGARVRVAIRRPQEGLFLKPLGEVGQIDIQQTNIRYDESIVRAVDGADYVINAVGALAPRGAQSFSALHVRGPEMIAQAAARAGVSGLVHVSAIGADLQSPAQYARTKAEGERRVRAAFPDAVILRPSVVFGPEDDFFNRFARMVRLVPVLPLVGFGVTRFQPVYVDDVAQAALAALSRSDAAGQTYELGGPEIFSFRQILEKILVVTERRAIFLPIPFGAARTLGSLMQMIPVIPPPLTRDQVLMLERDNIVAADMRGLHDLGVEPTPVDGVIETYLARFRPPLRQARFAR